MNACYLLDAFQVFGDSTKNHTPVELSIWLITTLPAQSHGRCPLPSGARVGIRRPIAPMWRVYLVPLDCKFLNSWGKGWWWIMIKYSWERMEGAWPEAVCFTGWWSAVCCYYQLLLVGTSSSPSPTRCRGTSDISSVFSLSSLGFVHKCFGRALALQLGHVLHSQGIWKGWEELHRQLWPQLRSKREAGVTEAGSTHCWGLK